MKAELLALISVDRDAAATNRGFYYQFLSVALKWIKNYVGGVDSAVYTEVEEDIKEVGEEIIFTQLKCYTSAFSFNSAEVKKSLLNFFYLYLKYHEEVEVTFNFQTNTALAKNEKLLMRWIDERPAGEELHLLCISKVSGILRKQIKDIRDKKFSKNKLSPTDKSSVAADFAQLDSLAADSQTLTDFIGRITWTFATEHPDQAIRSIILQITENLGSPIFGSRPTKILLEAMLSEIYKKSQLSDAAERKVNRSDLQRLLDVKDDELEEYINHRLITSLNVRFDLIENELNKVKEVVNEIAGVQQEYGKLFDQVIKNATHSRHEVPKWITRLPYLDSSQVLGREQLLTDIRQELLRVRHVTLSGMGGMGKSTMLKHYLNCYQTEYDHILWINADAGLVDSISLSEEIAHSLSIPIAADRYTARFGQILSSLQELNGKNLVVIDGYIEDVPQLNELRSLQNWQILIGTRLRLSGWKNFTLGALSFDQAKELYSSSSGQSEASYDELMLFFDAVSYNTLTIVLVAKTILNSLDLNLSQVMAYFEDQDLDHIELQIDIPDIQAESPRILNILLATFSLSALDQMEQFFLMYFAVLALPVPETEIMDVIDWFGKEHKEVNKTHVVNAINGLHTKGMIERHGKQFTMHRVLQQVLLYRERQSQNPFVAQALLIMELTSRLHEGSDHNLSQALRFLKYGEAILDNIKEPYRARIYQPMLKLENEVLNVYNWFHTEEDMSIRYENLYKRAKAYLLPGNSLTGVIANNYGLTLVLVEKLDEAMVLFDESAQILERQKGKALPQLLTTLCNLCHLYIKRGEMTKFSECFSRIKDIRDKNNLWEDVSLPLQSSVLGIANMHFQNYERAIEMFNMAINLHRELPDDQRNDMHLIGYLIHVTECFLATEQAEKAEQAIVYAAKVMKKINAKDTLVLGQVIRYMIIIAELKGDTKLAGDLRQRLVTLGYVVEG